jgi:hypothetical protein
MLRTQCQTLLIVAMMILLSPLSIFAQQSAESAQPSGRRQTAGVVESTRAGSVLIKTDDGKFVLFRVDRDTVRSQAVQVGARVNIITLADDSDATPLAIAVNVTQARPAGAVTTEAIPPEVRRLESRIAREVKRYRVGVEAGVALDPQLISVGAHATFSPVFNRNVSFRPNLELAAGEVTTLIALNLDVLYALPGATRQTRWAPYIGAGPNFSFSHQGFSSTEDGNRFDFGQFNADNGFNFIVGARNPGGMFVEMKATTYGISNVRFLVGYNF